MREKPRIGVCEVLHRKAVYLRDHLRERDDPPHEGAASLRIDLECAFLLAPGEDRYRIIWLAEHSGRTLADRIEFRRITALELGEEEQGGPFGTRQSSERVSWTPIPPATACLPRHATIRKTGARILGQRLRGRKRCSREGPIPAQKRQRQSACYQYDHQRPSRRETRNQNGRNQRQDRRDPPWKLDVGKNRRDVPVEVEGGYAPGDWETLESRVEANTDVLLGLFDETGARATFFLVGWVAERHPQLVRRITEAGHEVASHSYAHEVVANHSRASLAEDLARSKRILEDLSGQPVLGFRAPGGSITHETAWALDVIAETGFRYDASLNPGHSSHGGFATPHVGPHRLRCHAGELDEIPWTTVGVAGRRLPFAGGGYLRLLPYGLIRTCVGIENRAGRPATVYVHPREIDPDQPRMALPWKRRFKYYVGIGSTARKLRALLREHRFVTARAWLEAESAALADRIFDVRGVEASAPGPRPATARPVA